MNHIVNVRQHETLECANALLLEAEFLTVVDAKDALEQVWLALQSGLLHDNRADARSCANAYSCSGKI